MKADFVPEASGLVIRVFPDPVLRQPSEKVAVFDGELVYFVEKLFRAMREYDGVGLAAPQVGVSKRIAVIEYSGKLYTLINPRILESEGEQVGEEGCLSFPGFYASVKRPAHVKLETQDVHGNVQVYSVSEFLARAFCHEMDHLDGKLFIDHLSPLKRGMIRKKMLKRASEGQG